MFEDLRSNGNILLITMYFCCNTRVCFGQERILSRQTPCYFLNLKSTTLTGTNRLFFFSKSNSFSPFTVVMWWWSSSFSYFTVWRIRSSSTFASSNSHCDWQTSPSRSQPVTRRQVSLVPTDCPLQFNTTLQSLDYTIWGIWSSVIIMEYGIDGVRHRQNSVVYKTIASELDREENWLHGLETRRQTHPLTMYTTRTDWPRTQL